MTSVKRPPPLIGVNVPWFGGWYGHDLGKNQAYPGWPACDVERVAPKLLQTLTHFDVRLVRIWLFENGEGLKYDSEARVTGLDRGFLGNLELLVRVLDELDISVYWTLLDANSVRRSLDGVTRSILVDPVQTRAFCRIALDEVLPRIAPSAWAVDLCNEPEAMIRGRTGNLTGLGFDWWDLQPSLAILREAVASHLPGVQISIGSGFREDQNLASGLYERLGLELDFLDYHSHVSRSDFTHAGRLSARKDIVVGELGVPVPHELDPSAETWKLRERRLLAALHGAMSAGYKAIFLWSLSSDFSKDVQSLIYKNAPGLVLHSLRGLEEGGHVRTSVSSPVS